MPKLGFSDEMNLGFQSYQGFRRMFLTGREMYGYFDLLLEWSLKNGFGQMSAKRWESLGEGLKKSYQTYKGIRILDTFFSDTILSKIPAIVEETHRRKQKNQGEFVFQLLLLDPYSPIAQIRADSIATIHSPEEEIVKVLSRIYNGLKDVNPQRGSLSKSDMNLPSLLKYIHEWGPKSNVFVRFYNSLTIAPVYLISQFALKGLLLEGVSSYNKPWLVFVDDIVQESDIYAQFSDNFNRIFGEDHGDVDQYGCKIFRDTPLSWKWPFPNRALSANPKVKQSKLSGPGESIREKINSGRIDDAILELEKSIGQSAKNKTLRIEILTVQSNWNNLKRENDLKLISPVYFDTNRNRIINTIFNYLFLLFFQEEK